MAQCLVIIKPDAVKAGNVGRIISILEDQSFRISYAQLTRLTYEKACEFYAEHKGKDFFERNARFMSSGPILLLLVCDGSIYALQTIKHLRNIAGETDPKKARVGTIRHLFGTELPKNTIHVSDSVKSLAREMNFFSDWKNCIQL